MRVIAFYLPQYHCIPENDEWWGKGFTEWTNVKNSRPLYDGHNQPRKPLDDNYYDLDNDFDKVMDWQIKLAKKYKVYGFCMYHYWFKGGKKLLERPLEKFLDDKTKTIPFCICWANEPWTRTWSGNKNEIIMPQEYGGYDEWVEHFYYFLPFFKDERYIMQNGRPLLVIYRPELIDDLDSMIECWQELAKKEGIKGLFVVSQGSSYGTMKNTSKLIDAFILYEPGHTQAEFSVTRTNLVKDLFMNPRLFFEVEGQKVKSQFGSIIKSNNAKFRTTFLNYDTFWKHILNRKIDSDKLILGAFLDWDNSPRRKNKGARIFRGASPQKFAYYFSKLVKKAEEETLYDMIFINAWNEWSEGTYLEPDIKNGFAYLAAVKKSVK